MKFTDLKKDLEKNIRPAYLISGQDRYLCYSALDLIKKALNISLIDLNQVTLSGESVSKEDIARAVSVYPFVDQYRLVQVNGFNNKVKSKSGNDELLDYLKNPIENSVLVFFNLEGTEALKPYESLLTKVDCDKLDDSVIANVIKSRLNKESVQIESKAIEKLILFCNNDMARISSELEKLTSYTNKETITEKAVEALVVQDKEYQIFELSEFLCKGQAEQAMQMIYQLTSNSKSGFALIAPLYNNFKRALFVAINKDKTEEQLAVCLGVKPYAVKMSKNYVKYFTPKKLKKIVDLLYEADRNTKMGKIKEEVAIKTVALNILKIRGE